MTEQTKVHYTLREVFEIFFPEYRNLDHWRRHVLPALIEDGFPARAPYSSRFKSFFNKKLVDAYFNPPDPHADPRDGGGGAAEDPGAARDWGRELVDRAGGGEG